PLLQYVAAAAAAAAAAPFIGRRQTHIIRRQMAPPGLVDRDIGVYQLERQLGGPPQPFLDARGVVPAGQLDEDAILALALDRRFLGAGLVDAPADDLDRLL